MKKGIVALALGIGLLVFGMTAHAGEAKFELKANATMREILADRMGQRAALRLQTGEDIDGTVTMVGNGLVHISRLAGKDFSDAVVGIDKVSAVVFQARGR